MIECLCHVESLVLGTYSSTLKIKQFTVLAVQKALNTEAYQEKTAVIEERRRIYRNAMEKERLLEEGDEKGAL